MEDSNSDSDAFGLRVSDIESHLSIAEVVRLSDDGEFVEFSVNGDWENYDVAAKRILTPELCLKWILHCSVKNWWTAEHARQLACLVLEANGITKWF